MTFEETILYHVIVFFPVMPEYFTHPWIFRYEVTEGGYDGK